MKDGFICAVVEIIYESAPSRRVLELFAKVPAS